VTRKRGATAKAGKVVKQRPKAGRLLAPESKVTVKLE
jgi:beta-lactam-binding protein with PASTA domain